MLIYSVLPYTKDYREPILGKMKSFTDKREAYRFSDEYEYVQLITNELI